MSKLRCFAGLARGLCAKPSVEGLGASRLFSDWLPEEKITHTDQRWAENDYRLARFIDKPKHINPNWAVKLIDTVPPTVSKSRVVACDGGGGPTGHPKVYINLDRPGSHACGYCGLRFTLDQKCINCVL